MRPFKTKNGLDVGKMTISTSAVVSPITGVIDLSQAGIFTLTTSQNVTLSFINVPDNTLSCAFVLKVDAGHSVTYPNSVKFSGGEAPALSGSGLEDVLIFVTSDGGISWYASLAGVSMT